MKPDFSIKEVYKHILKDLYESVSGLYVYTFSSRYNLTPKETFEFIRTYKNKDYLEYVNDRIILTKNGKRNVFSKIFHRKMKKGLRSNLPTEYKGEKINIDTPYVPLIPYLGEEFKRE